jgi:hypothetical protein
MSVHAHQSLSEHQFRTELICSIPAGGAGERMTVYGANVGRGAAAAAAGSRTFSGGLVGKTLLITDTLATSVAQKEIKFKSSDFAKGDAPTLSEIVAAINAVLSLDATPTLASVGAVGELVLAAAATSATGGLTIGAGTANVLLGLPKKCSVSTFTRMRLMWTYRHTPRRRVCVHWIVCSRLSTRLRHARC